MFWGFRCLPVDIELLEGSGKKYYDLVKPDFYNGCKETKGQQEVLHVDAGDRWASFNVVGAATGDQITSQSPFPIRLYFPQI